MELRNKTYKQNKANEAIKTMNMTGTDPARVSGQAYGGQRKKA